MSKTIPLSVLSDITIEFIKSDESTADQCALLAKCTMKHLPDDMKEDFVQAVMAAGMAELQAKVNDL